ncbi:hypothetical protein D3C87_2103100 [compost metagenome]
MIPAVGFLGEKKKLGFALPSPHSRSAPTERGGCEITGKIQRVIRFQSSPSEIGITG